MDQLWTPILAHWRGGEVDKGRMLAHMRSLDGSVRSILIAGSTGDGWEVDDRQFIDLLELLSDARTFGPQVEVLIGLLRGSTAEVLHRLELTRDTLARVELKAKVVGVTVCPPVDDSADQPAILAHYEAILAASPWPLAVYQLPQVTKCVMEPETVATLARHPDVRWFKDSSGADIVANAVSDYGTLALVRGAEGNYLQQLKPKGRYDGWLLSTGNAFARPLRAILDSHAHGDDEEASRISGTLTAAVDCLFDEAAKVPFGNAFSNANRAADHINAHGTAWRDAPAPETISGNRLPMALLQVAADIVEEVLGVPSAGYLQTQ